MNWHRIIGAIATLLGGGIAISSASGFNEIGGAGQIVGIILGFLLLSVGLHWAIPTGRAKEIDGLDR